MERNAATKQPEHIEFAIHVSSDLKRYNPSEQMEVLLLIREHLENDYNNKILEKEKELEELRARFNEFMGSERLNLSTPAVGQMYNRPGNQFPKQ